MKSSRVLFSWAVLCLLLSDPLPAAAGGFATARFGGEHGHVAADHVTAAYYNPAGLARVKGTHLYIEGLFVYRTAAYERPEGAIDDVGTGTPNDPTALAANSGRGELANFLVSPFLGVSSDLGIDNFGASLAVYAPFGGQASWGTIDQFADDQQYPGAFDGPQRWHTIEGAQRALYVTAAGAYEIIDGLSVGVGFNLVSQSISVLRARNLDGTDDLLTPTGGLKEGRTLIDGTDLSYSVGLGVQYEPVDGLWLGLSYQSTPGFGATGLDGQLYGQYGQSGQQDPVDTTLLFHLPDIIRFGLQYRPSAKFELRAGGDYQRWSKFASHCLITRNDDPQCTLGADGAVMDVTDGATVLVGIPRNWKDTFGVRVGGSYWAIDGMELFGGVGYDSNAIPDETLEAGLMDMDKVVSTLGVRYSLMDSLLLTGSLTNVFYFSRDVAPRTPENTPVQPSLSPDGAGTYTQSINLLTVGALYAF